MKQARNKSKKPEITLMTILAYEATAGADALLKKHGKQEAVSYQDLEAKLAKLYFDAPDKVALEKEMAEIHPHKNWILKTLAPVMPEKSVIVEPVEEIKTEKSGCGCGGKCGCGGNCPCKQQNSSFDGTGAQTTNTQSNKLVLAEYAGLIGLVAVIGLTYFVINKTSK